MSLPKRDGVQGRYYLIQKPDTNPEVLEHADQCIQDVLDGTAKEMTKDQLLSLWNADNWEVMSCGVYFTAHRADKELHINCNDYTEAEILAMPFWERLAQELDELDRQAHEILQKEFPDDEDIPDLPLTDITIDKSGCYGTFSLCYDTGDSPAGELYLNVSFDEQFVPSPKVGYDTF